LAPSFSTIGVAVWLCANVLAALLLDLNNCNRGGRS
jgi:hypothetical protein